MNSELLASLFDSALYPSLRTVVRIAGFLIVVLLGQWIVDSECLADGSSGALDLSATDPQSVERIIEAMLAPTEVSGGSLTYQSTPVEAGFILDIQFFEDRVEGHIHPERVILPKVAGMAVLVEGEPVTLQARPRDISDADLDGGFQLVWHFAPAGHRFGTPPYLAVSVRAIDVMTLSGKTLFSWQASDGPVCSKKRRRGEPRCVVSGIGREAKALSISPSGELVALAHGGMRPRLEVFNISGEPRLVWRSLFSGQSGGVVETAFSSNGRWVVALTADGRMHRFDAAGGGKHLTVRSSGLTARAIPPGDVMAVAGERGALTLWYLADGTIAWRVPPRRLLGPIDRLAASADGSRIATLEYDEDATVVRVWEINNRRMVGQFEVDAYAVADVALDATGDRLFIAHEREGLMSVEVKSGSSFREVRSGPAKNCRRRLLWAGERGVLGCSLTDGVVELNPVGKDGQRRYFTPVVASDWIVAAAAGGDGLAAVGEGLLLVW